MGHEITAADAEREEKCGLKPAAPHHKARDEVGAVFETGGDAQEMARHAAALRPVQLVVMRQQRCFVSHFRKKTASKHSPKKAGLALQGQKLLFYSGDTSEVSSELSDSEVVDEAYNELRRLLDRILGLEGIIEDAEPYGEEPYEFSDDGTYLTGDEAVEICEDAIEECIQEAQEILEALDEYYQEYDAASIYEI